MYIYIYIYTHIYSSIHIFMYVCHRMKKTLSCHLEVKNAIVVATIFALGPLLKQYVIEMSSCRVR